MVDTIGCECCGTPLSFGEVFRHNMAVDVAAERRAAQRILGDRLSPDRPKPICETCRTQPHLELRFSPRPAVRVLPLVAFAGAMLLTLALRGRA
jgi:hypothetical protein